MKFILAVLVALLPAVAYSIGEAGDTGWPKGARIEVELRLSAAVGTNGQVKVSGDLLIKNPSDTPLTIQDPHNRLVLAFLVFDPLGNPVVPKGLEKVDPALRTHSLSPRATHTYHFETLDFLTGSALFGYDLSPGKTYRVLAVYRPAGPNGPGFASQEVSLGTESVVHQAVTKSTPTNDTNKDCSPWVQRCLTDFESIRAGMTRGEIEGKFQRDGGLQGVLPVRFTHSACAYFKIDVEFDFKRNAADQNRAIWSKDDKATRISKPYIERPFLD